MTAGTQTEIHVMADEQKIRTLHLEPINHLHNNT
jgi:hypothetical protein